MSYQTIYLDEPFTDEQSPENNYLSTNVFQPISDFPTPGSGDPSPSDYQDSEAVRPFMSDDLLYSQESIPKILNSQGYYKEDDYQTLRSRFKVNIDKSREIHRHLMIKKDKWKPSELELAVLKLHYEKNKYPSNDERATILKNLNQNFNSNVDSIQNQRERGIKFDAKNAHKSIYRKFGKDELEFLKDSFKKNTYPKTEEMRTMAKGLEVNLSKIENWYKHNRRALSKKGRLHLKTKKYFKKDELSYLMERFEKTPRPTKEEMLEIKSAQYLNCSELQIKNWYSNKRKKLKVISKRQGDESHEADLHQMPFSFPHYTSQNFGSFESLDVTKPSQNLYAKSANITESHNNVNVPNLPLLHSLNVGQVHHIPNTLNELPVPSYKYEEKFINVTNMTSSMINSPNMTVPTFIIPQTPQTPTSLPMIIGSNIINDNLNQMRNMNVLNSSLFSVPLNNMNLFQQPKISSMQAISHPYQFTPQSFLPINNLPNYSPFNFNISTKLPEQTFMNRSVPMQSNPIIVFSNKTQAGMSIGPLNLSNFSSTNNIQTTFNPNSILLTNIQSINKNLFEQAQAIPSTQIYYLPNL